jgi:hypothetical protein
LIGEEVLTVLKRFLEVFLGLVQILWGFEGVGVCALLDAERVNLTVRSASSTSQISVTQFQYMA